ncbi:YdbH domain-containing protein [Rhizorhabdus sp. FW153]|uniref:YdbH domain-containing protein n=1 Tax=Rhizorhabdus sp. FW153 TaxID=3400216 RepID=UPI003CE8C863
MEAASPRKKHALIVAGASAVALATGGVWLWSERTPIAASYIDAMLREKGVAARYRLAKIGVRTHRIENVVIGDPRSPDLVADWAEVELGFGLRGVQVRAVDAGGLRIKGRFVSGKLSLGAVDRLLPEGQGDAPFALPAISLTARSVRADIASPAGLVSLMLDGAGRLDDGFRGRVTLSAPRLVAKDCVAEQLGAALQVTTADGAPRLSGPLRASTIDCAGVRLSDAMVETDLRGSSDLTQWRGMLKPTKGTVLVGRARIGTLGGQLAFTAGRAGVAGDADLRAGDITMAQGNVGALGVRGKYRVTSRGDADFDGQVSASDARLSPASTTALAGMGASLDPLPPGPVVDAWARALARAGAEADVKADIRASLGGDEAELRVLRVAADSRSGARLLLRPTGAAGIGWSRSEGVSANGSLEVSGGGLPHLLATARQTVPGGPLEGSASIAPYQTGQASLAFDPIAFTRDRRGIVFVTTGVRMSGPLADGRVDDARLPLRFTIGERGAMVVNSVCAPLSWSRLAIAGTTIGPSRLPLCPVGGALFRRASDGALSGGAVVQAPRLRGTIGGQPLSIEGRTLTASVGNPGFRLDSLAVRLGGKDDPTRLAIVRLDGRVDARGIAGSFATLSGKLASVPLLMSEGEGRWRLAGSRLSVEGGLQVADAQTVEPRFHPLRSDDVRLDLIGGRISAKATLKEPRSQATVTRVALNHDLSTSRGGAELSVDALTFGKGLQPEAITPLTLGMVANVEGRVSGKGLIEWRGGDVTSRGSFSTDKLDFAAAFGPVTGLKGTIHFVDLLGLVTAPDQKVMLAEVNPGIAVNNGLIRYRILPDRQLSIQSGDWPFAGGTLTLEPSVLDMARPVARRLTFRIDGLDAATFVQQLEFKNLAVTGKFDGVLPIIFDSSGGRIENGELRVRPGGGTLSYVGDVTNANLGRYARLAFDALKSMRYDRLIIDLNGQLDGEIVSRVRFDGTNDRPEETATRNGIMGRLLAPLTRLPFRFNITITAPFRGLVNSAQTFVDPSLLLRNGATAAPEQTPPASDAVIVPVPASIQPPIQPR